jgi:hypothetical protein
LGMKHATSTMTVMFCRLRVVELESQMVSKPFDAIAADESTAGLLGLGAEVGTATRRRIEAKTKPCCPK